MYPPDWLSSKEGTYHYPVQCSYHNNKRKDKLSMDIITKTQRYLPHTLDTRYYAVKLYRGGNPVSLFRVLRKLGYFKNKVKKKKPYIPKPYNTPEKPGIKWQLDVKHVPKEYYTGDIPERFYQYTVIDEASRERFIYPFLEQSSYSTIQFIEMAIKHFGYSPEIIQHSDANTWMEDPHGNPKILGGVLAPLQNLKVASHT